MTADDVLTGWAEDRDPKAVARKRRAKAQAYEAERAAALRADVRKAYLDHRARPGLAQAIAARVGALLTAARHRKGWTQERVAEACATPRTVIARTENARHCPTLHGYVIHAIAVGVRSPLGELSTILDEVMR